MSKAAPAWQKREDLFLVPAGGWVLAGTVLLSVALAGGRPLWAQGVITMGVGLLWAVWTPAKLPDKPVFWSLIALALMPLAAYLPSFWLGAPSWRADLAQYRAVAHSLFVTPQPWLTFHVWLLWLTGVALAAWCACQNWDHYHRGTLARMYAGGFVVIALFAIFAHATGNQPGWWPSTDGFGPFMNRNQWGGAMGFAGVVAIALLHQCVRQQHKRGVVFWFLVLCLLTGSIIFNGSRGGLVVLAAGGFFYWAFYGVMRKQYSYAAIALSFLLIAFALFSFGGGALLERFVGLGSLFQGEADEDFRVQCYRMTMTMTAASPLAGFGLGNFEYVFPFYLDFEPMFDRRPAHPESSWLWLVSEGGWLLVMVVAVAIVVLVVQAYSARRSRAATIRAAGTACGLMLAANATFEVNGHRLGTLFPVIFLASLALPAATDALKSAVAARAMRAAGCLIVMTGLVWFLAGFDIAVLPGVQGTTALRAKAEAHKKAGKTDEAVSLMQRAERLLPLDWGTHWTLSDWLLTEGKLEPAWDEFRTANALLPYLYWTIANQAEKWVKPSPARAVSALLEAMQRAPLSKRSEMYENYLNKSATHPSLRAMLLRLYPTNPEFEFVRIRLLPHDIGAKRLPKLLAQTDQLTKAPDHMVGPVLRLMLDRGLTEQLNAVVENNQRLKHLGWETLIEYAVRQGRTSDALDLYFSYGPRPALPAQLSRSDLRSIERASALAPMDISTSISYYQALVAARRDADALAQLRRIMDLPNAPAYIWFIAAQASHKRGEDAEAWGFLETFRKKTKP